MKIGIMGGTFNPIHNGHLILAHTAKEAVGLDEVWFMPSGLPAHKSNSELLSAQERLYMAELAIQGREGFKASSFEIDREGFTYTADTMLALHQAYPDNEFFFIIGGDTLMKFHHWVKPDVISAYATLLAAGRDGYSKEELTMQTKRLHQLFGTKVVLLDMPAFTVSSSDIRSKLHKRQFDVLNTAVPEAVLTYIINQRLYQHSD